ncbi:phosphotransferase family protein [Haloactinomyces albus]|uniref:Phosphotransferase enzyme family protein n=1 Tax=Haloactinomyces albus TaxID=1352928 RepID=A0AAE4CMC1_9ACTN|nr:hypothetical protein [Haloactinomyces albus]MDR7302231.1 hypothetical protein [Haloactinomyces albus]
MTATWNDLPGPVRAAVQRHTGPITEATPITDGQNNDLTAVLHAQHGQPVFVKGVCGVSRQMRWLRNEATTAPLTRGLSPAVLFSEDVDGWLIVGFECVAGRAASLAPGSADLPLVAHAVNRIGALPGPGLRSLRERWGAADWWHKLTDEAPGTVRDWDIDELDRWAALFPELADGDRLAHTDLHGDQILITGNTARVIDWGFPGCGAAWVDAAFMVLRLIEAGHRVSDAEAWAHAHLTHCPDGERLTAFAAHIAGLWSYWAATGDSSGAHGRARLARTYAARRLTLQPTPVGA